MPELPEVETIKNALVKGIGCARILDASVYQSKLRLPVPEDFKDRIINTQIISYRRIAKYIVIGLDNDMSIVWHMGMSGRIKISEAMPDSLEKHDHVVIKTDNGVMIYNDARRFGLITCFPTDNISDCPLFAKTGPDPFSQELTAKYLHEKFRRKKIPVKVALLDQSIIAGIGNIYASEALFDAGISPLRETDRISLKECGRLIESVRHTLEKAIEAGGSTLKDYHKPDVPVFIAQQNRSETQMMKHIYKSAILLTATFWLFLNHASAANFIDGLEDVPMPANMQQMPNDNLSFGNEESRLVEAYLSSSKIGFKNVEKFYMDTLPQLGWKFEGKRGEILSFSRDGESLDIAKEGSNPLVVRITVKSQN